MATRAAKDNEQCAFCGYNIEKDTRAVTVTVPSGTEFAFHPLHVHSFSRAVEREADAYADSHGNAETDTFD